MKNERSISALYFSVFFLLTLAVLFFFIISPTDIMAYGKKVQHENSTFFIESNDNLNMSSLPTMNNTDVILSGTTIPQRSEEPGTEITKTNPNYSGPKEMTDEWNTDENINNRNFLSYRDLDLGIEIEYPTNWAIEQTREDSIIFRSPLEDINDYTQEYLRLDVLPTSNLTMEDVIRVREDEPALNNLSIITPSISRTFANNPGKIMVYSYVDDIYGEIIGMKFVIHKNDKFYLMRYLAESVKFQDFLPTVTKIIDSLEIVPPLYYESFDMGLRVKYPSDWNYLELDETFDSQQSIEFYPKDGIISRYPPHFKIFLKAENVDTSLDEAVNQTIKDHKSIEGFHLISSSAVPNLMKDNLPSQMLNFSFQYSDFVVINASEIITIKDGKEYHLLYQAEKEEYLKYPIVNQIIDSLELVDILRYEKLFDDNSGVMLQYPNTYPWEIKEKQIMKEGRISNRTIELMENQFGSSSNLTLSVFPYQKSLDNLKNEIFSYYRESKLRFEILSEDTILIPTTGDENMTAYNVTFTYYDPTLKQDINGIHIYSKDEDNVYIINFMSSVDSYVLYLPSVKQMVDSFKIIEPLPVPLQNEFPYFQASYGFKFRHPLNWNISDDGSVVSLQIANSSAWLQISTLPSQNQNFYGYIENVMRDIIESNIGNIFDFSALNLTKGSEPQYQVEYRTGNVKNLDNFRLHERGTIYDIYYSADVNEYYNYIPIIRQIIESLDVVSDAEPRSLTGFSIGKGPAGIAVNPMTDSLYVTNAFSNTVSVLNGTNNEPIREIEVGNGPHGIAVNPSINTVYVANVDSNSVSVIDALRNVKIKDIEVGPDPLMVAVNPFSHMVYVADGSSHDVYIIDGSNNELIANITTGGRTNSLSGVGLAINHFTSKIYVANPITGNVTVIDGNTNHILQHIPLGSDAQPSDITINPFTNIAYIIESGYRTISAIDLSQNLEVGFRQFNGSLNILALNPFTNQLYATDNLLDAVYIMDTASFKEPDRYSLDILRIDSGPWAVTVNPNTNIVYAANSLSNTVTTINGTENNLLFGVKFDIYDGLKDYEIFGYKIPVNASKQVDMDCNGINILDNGYIGYNNGTTVKCTVHAKNIFAPLVSAFWSGLDRSPPVEFNVTRHGVLTGTFFDLSNILQALGLTISIVVLASIVFAASIPSILSRLRKVDDTDKKEVLSKTEVIAIDASIIVGVLFFLTISEGFAISEQTQITIVTANIVFPFAISAVLEVINREKFAMRLMVAGFINLMVSVILIAIMRL